MLRPDYDRCGVYLLGVLAAEFLVVKWNVPFYFADVTVDSGSA